VIYVFLRKNISVMQNSSAVPSVILAGAGPGDPELISVKALKAIKAADVILYDALVNPELLGFANDSCKLVNVGKRKGKREFTQEEINELIVFYACRYTKVLRLKGGDPYVFGRGHEELEYVVRRGIRVEVIPGISSAIAAPAAIGIPVTKRGSNESFWVITGMVSSGAISKDIVLAAQSSATVIILMGMTHLAEISKLFAQHRSPLEPAAIIQHGTLPEQRFVISNVSQLKEAVEHRGLSSPAVIVIGKVVNESSVHEILSQPEVLMKVAV
jgi:uroporphyrin-III C-methyltransferase